MSVALMAVPTSSITYHALSEVWGNPEFGTPEELSEGINALLNQLGPEFRTNPDRLRVYSGLPMSRMMLAFSGRRVVGKMNIAVLFEDDMTHGVIENVVVDECTRKCGVGSELFQRCLAYAKHWQVEYLTLASGNHRPWAHAFYKSLGFSSPSDQTTFVYELE